MPYTLDHPLFSLATTGKHCVNHTALKCDIADVLTKPMVTIATVDMDIVNNSIAFAFIVMDLNCLQPHFAIMLT